MTTPSCQLHSNGTAAAIPRFTRHALRSTPNCWSARADRADRHPRARDAAAVTAQPSIVFGRAQLRARVHESITRLQVCARAKQSLRQSDSAAEVWLRQPPPTPTFRPPSATFRTPIVTFRTPIATFRPPIEDVWPTRLPPTFHRLLPMLTARAMFDDFWPKFADTSDHC